MESAGAWDVRVAVITHDGRGSPMVDISPRPSASLPLEESRVLVRQSRELLAASVHAIAESEALMIHARRAIEQSRVLLARSALQHRVGRVDTGSDKSS